MSAITHIILHCSDSEFGDVAMIRSWHVARGWKDIGYHFVIENGRPTKQKADRSCDGKVTHGRKLDDDNFIRPDEVGAHALGYNARSIGICMIGVKDFSSAQIQSARALVYTLIHKHGIPLENVLGHYETESGKAEGKTCPNLDMGWFRAIVRT
jgi:hypothetical protein